MKTTLKLILSAFLIYLISLIVFICLICYFFPDYLIDTDNYPDILLLSLLPPLISWAGNIGKPRKELAVTGREQVKYPPVHKEMLFRLPEGFVFGKDRHTGKYICKPLSEDGHIFVIGGSGSGKSSCFVIPTLLMNDRFFAIDIKGELSYKTQKLWHETNNYKTDNSENYNSELQTIICNPDDRNSFGYNPFYALTEESSSQDILEAMQTIAFALVSLPAELKDPFWKNGARNLLTGLSIYYYKRGNHDFISIIDRILGKPIKEQIDEVMENACPGTNEYFFLVAFKDMAEETIGGIFSEVTNNISIFSTNQNVRYFLKDNPHKANPVMLEAKNGMKFFLTLKEEHLEQYANLLKLIISQVLMQLTKRKEGSPPVIVMLDELPRILSSGAGAGKLSILLEASRTLRSRGCHICAVSQSQEALMTVYSENEVTDFVSNCAYILCLGANSPKTIKALAEWGGKALIKKTSWTGSGKEQKANTSFDEQEIVRATDLMTLKQTGDAIIISPYGYNRIRKTPYYKDRYFKNTTEEIRKFNDAIMDL